MNELVGIILVIVGAIGLMKQTGEVVKNSKVLNYDLLYDKYGKNTDLDPLLIKAIAIVESSENHLAENPNDPSVGLMQILCVPDGQGGCSNRLNIPDWPPQGGKAQLFEPDYNVKIATDILAWNTTQYGRWKGVAVYNSWSAHHDPSEGPFVNQGYVDKVRKEYLSLGGIDNA